MDNSRALANNKQISEAFHLLWTKAANQTNYTKSEWLNLWKLLNERGIGV
jgi:hypothetical protein